MTSWKNLEDKVRDISKIIWSRDVLPDRIAGVNFDNVIKISEEELVIIEVTEECNLDKIRSDVAKIQPVKFHLFSANKYAKSYIVLKKEPTQGMKDIGSAVNIEVVSIDSFSKKLIDYDSYISIRKDLAFGSAINPTTGLPDNHKYIPVEYSDESGKRKFNTQEISLKLSNNEKIILLGDYGTGKSRCTKEIFVNLSNDIANGGKFVFAINLREHWGATSADEIIAGHLKKIGLSNAVDRTIQLLNAGHIILILDGFDEVGSQTFGAGYTKKESVRKNALSGVRDLVSRCKAGVLITGRPHYFNSNREMYDCLGISVKHHHNPIIQCSTEFDLTQAQSYLSSIGIASPVPQWLPRKPLMFLVLAEIEKSQVENILTSDLGEVDFWGQFIDTICEREAKIHNSIDPSSVRDVLANLAKITRVSDRELGRLTPKDINQAYEDATGVTADESGQQMLSRLCTLGRIEPESPDRQFVDPYIVQLLFAENLVNEISNRDPKNLNVIWKQSLKEIGLYFLAQWIDSFDIKSDCLLMIQRESSPKNSQMLGELIAALSLLEGDDLDFHGISLSDGEISILNLGTIQLKGVKFNQYIFEKITFESCKISKNSNFNISDSYIQVATGLTSQNALPEWIENTKIENPQSASNSSRIKSSNLPPSQKLLLSLLQKIFFQRGGGRKESSLYKGGFGQKFDRKLIDQILSILVNEDLVHKSKDNSGFIYNPRREYTPRMRAIKDQLSLSKDPLWLKVLELEKNNQ